MNKVLFLGPENERIIRYLAKIGHSVKVIQRVITEEDIKEYDYYISFGYTHIIPYSIIKLVKMQIINIHISYLPWNRGTSPNLWSILSDTPKGISIHQIDEGIDTGPIYVQKEIIFEENDTLRTSYNKLITLAEDVFIENWENIRDGKICAISQKGKGSYQSTQDTDKYQYLLIYGLDTPISLIKQMVMREQC
ncbi:formyltransferase family protein [Lysinibacillus sp. FSL K6-0057]|uniref:formyltransferase family protein n=1 Tax=Lysinibacillus sp. FSL K6-0057 TaxID=2921411 RepID=UPI00315B21F6